MLRRGAQTIRTTRCLSIVVWMVTLLASSAVCADTQVTNFSGNSDYSINDRLLIDIECSERQFGDAFCSFKTDIQYSNYLNTPLSAHESYLFSDSEGDQRKADLLAIFRLAIEEFKCLSNVKLYWELTEQNLEELAIKLRLKGEIPISDPAMHDSTIEKNPKGRRHSVLPSSRSASRLSSAIALFVPSKLQWNIGMDPNDMTVFGELNLNAYMTLSGEFGDTN
ncbi:MAG: hypothetical protein PVG41_10305, partial [Desulfobacteraceae bacterium]